MRILSIFNEEKRQRHLGSLKKRILRLGKPVVATTPIFVLGKQRSGTTMLFNYFESRQDTETYNESDQRIFTDFQLHPLPQVQALLNQSRAPFTVFKSICDSHRMGELFEAFPNARVVWAQRDCKDVANSSIRHFPPHWKTGLQIICKGQSGGGWFVQGVSEKAAAILREVYKDSLSPFEMSCLVWWARNQIAVENQIDEHPQICMVQYEDLVTQPAKSFESLNKSLGLPSDPQAYAHVHSRSIGRNEYPPVAKDIQILCKELQTTLILMAKRSGKTFERD